MVGVLEGGNGTTTQMKENCIHPFPILGVEEGVVGELGVLEDDWVGDVDGFAYHVVEGFGFWCIQGESRNHCAQHDGGCDG